MFVYIHNSLHILQVELGADIILSFLFFKFKFVFIRLFLFQRKKCKVFLILSFLCNVIVFIKTLLIL